MESLAAIWKVIFLDAIRLPGVDRVQNTFEYIEARCISVYKTIYWSI
jgi:hypothetical protein